MKEGEIMAARRTAQFSRGSAFTSFVVVVALALPASAKCPDYLAFLGYSAGTRPDSVIAADFNNDGRLDLAVANVISNNVSILLGNSSDQFNAAVNITADNTPYVVVTADFNGDGNADLAVGNYNSND